MTAHHDPHALTVARQLQDRVAPAQVVLFGSRARGDWHADSDIDLMVIADDPTRAQRREYASLGWQLLKPEAARLYPEPVEVQIFTMARAEFEWARRARMHLAGGVQHDGLTAQGEPMPPIEQNDPWPAVQKFLRVSHAALFRALRAEGEGDHKEAALQAHHALETALKAYASALELTFRKSHDLYALIGRIEEVEQAVDFTAMTYEWCTKMLELRRTGPYETDVDLFWEAADILDLVQQICGAAAGRALTLVARRPDEVGYRMPAAEARDITVRADRPLGGLEDTFPSDFAPERLVEQGRLQGQTEGLEQGQLAERRRILLEAARAVSESSGQPAALIRYLDRNPPAAWPSVVDLIEGRWPSNTKQKDTDKSEPPFGSR